MTRRIQSCVNFDKENLEWVKAQPGGMSEYLNRYIKACRDAETPENVVTNIPGLEEIKERSKQEDIAIGKFFTRNPHIVYLAKAKHKRGKKEICWIKQELFYKCGIRANEEHIQIQLKKAMDSFDVDAYETAKGLPSTTKVKK
jgi:hypothetical protein